MKPPLSRYIALAQRRTMVLMSRRGPLLEKGRDALLAIQNGAEAAGVFGVPSFLLDDGDLYWGREHLPRIRELLLARSQARRADV
jgi:2-hydroxychromene-2-carboxylate isomerase